MIGAVVTAIAIWLSYTYQLVAMFPSSLQIGSVHIGLDVGTPIINAANAVTNWAQTSFSGVTNGIKDVVTAVALDPLQALLDQSPWWLTFVAITAIAALVGGWIAAVITAVCLGLILWPLELWQATMDTLAAVLVATVIVVVLGVVVGVWMGRGPTGRQDHAAVPGRRADDAGIRLPGAVPGAVRGDPVHRHRGGDGVRRAGVDQDHRRRHPRRFADNGRGGDVGGVEHLADHHQGAAADVRSHPGAGHATRA